MRLSLKVILALGLILLSIILHASMPSLFRMLVYRLETSKVARIAPSGKVLREDRTLRKCVVCFMYGLMSLTPGCRKKSCAVLMGCM